MNFINKKYLIISVILLINIANGINANTIIFKLNKLIYTSEDLEKRTSYIRLKDKTLNVNKDKCNFDDIIDDCYTAKCLNHSNFNVDPYVKQYNYFED